MWLITVKIMLKPLTKLVRGFFLLYICINKIKYMWKALIKLVEKWAYRCEHNWIKENTQEVYRAGEELPREIIRTYVCDKCMKCKKLS